jgi:HK97 gp10 family phage protein
MITFEIKGLKEMGDELAKLPAKIARRALAAAVREGANVVRTRARATAPIGTKTYKDYRGKTHRPGLLRKSGVISKKLRPRDWQNTALFGVGFSKRGYYGRWIEWGKSKKHKYAPHPFVLPAMEQTARQVVETLKSRLGRQLEGIVRESRGLIIK